MVLTFDQTDPPTVSGGVVNQAYGDRVTAASDAAGSYGLFGSGFTPNVVVEYSDGGGPINNANIWPNGFGDLLGVLFNNADGDDRLTVTFTADPGFLVQLHSFDMAGWLNADYTIAGVRVNDGTVDLFSQSNVFVRGSASQSPRHTSFLFATPLEAQVIQIYIDLTGLGAVSDNIGVDNIAFSQVGEAVPEPATLFRAAAAGLLLIARRRFRIRTSGQPALRGGRHGLLRR